MALITTEELRRLPLGLTEKMLPDENALVAFIETASDWVEDWCDRSFASASRVQEIEGKGTNRLILEHWPCTALTSVAWEDTSGFTGTHATSLFRLRSSGVLEWKDPGDGPFHTDRHYTITYTAGYASVPDPIKHAVALRTIELMAPGYNRAPVSEDTTMEIATLLDKYKRRRYA